MALYLSWTEKRHNVGPLKSAVVWACTARSVFPTHKLQSEVSGIRRCVGPLQQRFSKRFHGLLVCCSPTGNFSGSTCRVELLLPHLCHSLYLKCWQVHETTVSDSAMQTLQMHVTLLPLEVTCGNFFLSHLDRGAEPAPVNVCIIS